LLRIREKGAAARQQALDQRRAFVAARFQHFHARKKLRRESRTDHGRRRRAGGGAVMTNTDTADADSDIFNSVGNWRRGRVPSGAHHGECAEAAATVPEN